MFKEGDKFYGWKGIIGKVGFIIVYVSMLIILVGLIIGLIIGFFG